ncbi:MAG: AAA family ATPase [Candidatus Heimdallarchaeota archaeon]|nr:MAG: AAA family ATPase [Candidatus Heimdallarchaeota archaeon]
MGSAWVQKHAPRRRSEVVGNKDSVNSIIAYLNRFRNPKLRSKLAKKAILLYGPPGIGKTSSVLAIAKGLNFDVVTVNASDNRNKNSLQSVRNASVFSSLKENLDSKVVGQILLIDEVDGLSGTADRGGLKEIVDIINSTRIPLILTANDVSPQKFKTLRKYCELREFKPPRAEEILDILHRIIEAESISVSDKILLELIEMSQNDIRGSINSLQTLASGKKEIVKEDLNIISYRDTTIDIREFLRTLFVEADGEKAYQQTRTLSDVDYSKLLLLLRDLSIYILPKNNYDQISQVYDLLARADVALTRSQRKMIWSQLAYFYSYCTKELASVITPVAELPSFPDWQLQVPSYWITLSRQKKGRRIATKVGRACQVSSQSAINFFMPYLRFIFQHNPEKAAELAIEFQFFDVEPGKRKTKIVWNGEIDYFVKRKEINRAIKKRIRQLYPQLERIQEREVNVETLEQIREQQRLMRKEARKGKSDIQKDRLKKTKAKKPKKRKIAENKKKKSKKNDEHSPKTDSRKRKNEKLSSEKTLTDYF